MLLDVGTRFIRITETGMVAIVLAVAVSGRVLTWTVRIMFYSTAQQTAGDGFINRGGCLDETGKGCD